MGGSEPLSKLLRDRLSRLDLDRVVPLAVAAILFVWLAGVALLRWHALEASYDLGYFTQAAWLVANGKEPFVTLAGLHLLGDHAVFLFYPLAWLTRVLPTVPTLLIAQSAALALGVLPLWSVCRKVAGLEVTSSTVMVGAYSLYPAVHNVNWADFHPEVLAVPAIFGAVLFGATRRWVPYGVCVALTLLAREDMAVVIASLGVLLLLQREARAGAVTLFAAVVWFLVDTTVVLPHFAAGEFVQGGRLSPYGESFGEITTFMVTHPFTVASDFVTAANLGTLVGLLAPLCFLPLLAPQWLLPGLPLQAFYFLSKVPAAHTIDAQYTVAFIPFASVAAAVALSRFPVAERRRSMAVLVLLASVLLYSQLAFDGPGRRPTNWITRNRLDSARLAAVRLVPDDASVSASLSMWTLLAERRDLYNFPRPFERYDLRRRDPVPLNERRGEVSHVVIDTAVEGQWPSDLETVRQRLLPGLGFNEIFSREGIVVYRRVGRG